MSDYNYLRDSLLDTNVIEDNRYKIRFKRYYAMDKQRWDSKWDKLYFSLLEHGKNNKEISFHTTLELLYAITGKVQTSFSSKLIATVNPEMPVYDKWVRKNLGLKVPYSGMKDDRRIPRFVTMHSELQSKAVEMTQDINFEKLRTRFNQTFPQYECFTDIKKLDLFLWQARLGSCPLIPCVLQLKEIGYRINGD